jgi:hypothetical protein
LEEPEEDGGVIKTKTSGIDVAPPREEAKATSPKFDIGLTDLLDAPAGVPEKKAEVASTITMLEEVFKDIGGQPNIETPAPVQMPVNTVPVVAQPQTQSANLLSDDVKLSLHFCSY